MALPEYPPAPMVERKVKAATAGAFLGLAALLYALELIAANPVLVTPLPDWLEPPAIAVVPSLVVLVAGYLARHTPRPDLPDAQR